MTCILQAENIYGAYTSAQEIKTIRLTAVVLMYQLYYIQMVNVMRVYSEAQTAVILKLGFSKYVLLFSGLYFPFEMI